MLNQEMLLEWTETYLKALVADASGATVRDIDTSAPFGELGIDSFRVLKIIKALEADFGPLPKTLLFEHFNVGSLARHFADKYGPALEAMQARAAPVAQTEGAGPGAAVDGGPARPAALAAAAPVAPIRLFERDLHLHPELAALVGDLFERHKNEGCVSRGTRNIAPNLFIGSKRKGYFNYSRSQNTILVYAYTGPEEYFPEIAAEMYRYCCAKQFQLNIFLDAVVSAIDGVQFSATPFGVLQRVCDIRNFTLEGGPMRRLRYQVSKFEKAGACRTGEYKCGSDPQTDRAIAGVIDLWCADKTMVNPLIRIVREEILAGSLHPQHRIFLTHVDDTLQNVILISRMCASLNGYLMDLEFYGREMPLGGLEYAIVKIIETLAAEGCDMLSMGGTYGCRLETSPSADPEIDRILDDLHRQNIFNDEGNLQFKNKFRCENRTIYLCRPVGSGNADNVIDIIMMIADPARAQTPDAENHNAAGGEPAVCAGADTSGESSAVADEADTGYGPALAGTAFAQALAEHGFNPLNIPSAQVDFDLKTDSWAQCDAPFVARQMQHLRTQLQQPASLADGLQAAFPFRHVLLTDAGRTSDSVFCAAWARKGIVLQNLLFPTSLYHQVDNGLTPRELPHPELFQLESDAAFKGELDWDALREALERDAAGISYVCLDLCNNSAGGQPVSLAHLRQLRQLLGEYDIALVIDATRVLDNACALIERENGQAGRTIWEVARDTLACADVVIGSLAKDFCVNKGGIIATNDEALLRRCQAIMGRQGGGLDAIERKLVALSLANLRHIEVQVQRRVVATRLAWNTLKAAQVPVVHPAGAHCVLVDVKRIASFAGLREPVASFLAWLYLHTGIRAGAHSVGMQKDSALNGLVRLAIPLGLKQEQAAELAQRIAAAFGRMCDVPELERAGGAAHGYADVHANYTLVRYHRPSGAQAAPQPGAAPARVPLPQPAGAAPAADAGAAPGRPAGPVHTPAHAHVDIAVVGMAGRYPKAGSLDEFWDNLRQGRDCVTDMPEERFAPRAVDGPARRYRGGFLDDIDRFDSLFFNISPREAEVLDPQERLFLEVAWEALEDAGYYPEILAPADAPRRVGVFVGAVWAMYQMVAVEEKRAGRDVNANSFLWSIANRVSYWMNLTGPSLTVDTACSSSLTAVHLACEAIRRGDCDSAIVGGVNLDLHQHKFDINWAGGALSPDGLCRSFGAGANGYVAGEGAGALYLKSLARAQADGDHVYGVIRSAVVNHGGRTSGYTVPNPKAQGELVALALRTAGIDARSIGYIEAHGTGTELGDPIEIAGLNNVFAGVGADIASCAIGSVKTNIGHLEAAAGVVGMCKVLLQMQYRQLVPSLHSREPNAYIDFAASPLRVQQELASWEGREVDGIRMPLRAGVSSFGAGGANAHVVLESIALEAGQQPVPAGGYLFPLSARNGEQLRAMALRLRTHLTRDFVRHSLADIAFTLQNGRKSFEERLAIVAASDTELLAKLDVFLEGEQDSAILVGHARNAEGVARLLSREEQDQFVGLLAQGRDPRRLAQLWIDGFLPDCRGLMQGTGRRTSLPTYPFADKRHWIGSSRVPASPGVSGRQPAIHPLIDSNESTFQRQLFKKTFHAHEYFLREHVVSGVPTLPGAAYLDLARKAGEIAAGTRVHKLRNITWLSPLALGEAPSLTAFVELRPEAGAAHFEVFAESADGDRKRYAQGKLEFAPQQAAPAEYVDLAAIRSRCTRTVCAQQAYALFASLGMAYGQSFQVVHEVSSSDDEVLGALRLPAVRGADFDAFALHPCIFDAAMQAGVMAQLGTSANAMTVPYSIGEVEILHPLTRTCYSYVVRGQGRGAGVSRDNVTIVDENGMVLARIRESVGVALSSLHEKPAPQAAPGAVEALYYTQRWQPQPLSAAPEAGAGPILLFGTDAQLHAACVRRGIDAVLVLPGARFERVDRLCYRIDPQAREHYVRLFQALADAGLSVGQICYAWAESTEPADAAALARFLDRGPFAFLLLCQGLIAHKPREQVRLLYLYAGEQAHNAAISGFVKSLRLENPAWSCKVVQTEPDQDGEQLLDRVLAELRADAQEHGTVRYAGAVRQVRLPARLTGGDLRTGGAVPVSFKHNGVYLITGGAGGLGLIFAQFLATQCNVRLVLTGRSAPAAEIEARLDVLRSLGAQVCYVAADISDAAQVRRLVEQTRTRWGGIDGIIHAAGVLRDSLVRNKTREEMEAVFAPKIHGTVHLDEATRDEELDFFVLFSSLAAVGGNAGQCDYAFANHFMDSFAAAREARRAHGSRHGRTLSLNWSLWAEGGMRLDAQTEAFFRKNLGIVPLKTQAGTEAFAMALPLSESQVAVLEGEPAKIEAAWGIARRESAVPAAAAVREQGVGADPDELGALVVHALAEQVMAMLKLPADDLSVDSILLDLGFDSIGLAGFADAINGTYGLDINPVLFFEYPSIRAIAGVLTAQHRGAIEKVHGNLHGAAQPAAAPAAARETGAAVIDKGRTAPASGTVDAAAWRERRFAQEPIAIVGIAGVMPQSDNVQQFWDNLRHGRNLVTEVPRERWIWEDYHGDPVKETNKSNSRWGGFMKQVDQFDPLFFGITPREAEMMDPQQRIFLETVWSAIEDAGHKVSDLAGTRTGVFVGVSAKDYVDELALHGASLDGYSASGNSHSILANRVSFLLNLRGPSAPIDTACSSSLIALHRAIESIHTGSCEMAIVGGVQVMLTPVGHISLSSAGMLSPDGKCKTFARDANGYVRGEGAGAVFIKPLAQAEADGNPIYAVVRASAENHGGRVTMLTAPNPKAQAELLAEAYGKAGIDPASVGYIECHGTGTSLGDPIEIQALKNAFADLYRRHGKDAPGAPHCALGSVKTNIGHLEPAAGIAGLLKVLLAIRHKEIPAMLHCDEINPYIDLAGTPFYIAGRTTSWDAPHAADGAVVPRRAGVSSFGWGGANAHVVLEEYLPPARLRPAQETQVVVLSARNAERLNAYATALLERVRRDDVDLVDLAHTLQVGRDRMQERLAVVAGSLQELGTRLDAYLATGSAAGLYRGYAPRSGHAAAAAPGPGATAAVGAGQAERLARSWVEGGEVEWDALRRGGVRPRRISLPTYPFARERYWIAPATAPAAPNVAPLRSPEVGDLLACPVWEPSPAVAVQATLAGIDRHLVLLCAPAPANPEQLEALLPRVEVVRLAAPGGAGAAERYSTTALACFEQVQAILKARAKGRVLLQVVAGSEAQDALLAGLAGLFQSARMENQRLAGQVILGGATADAAALAARLQACAAQPDEALFKYEHAGRSVLRWQEQDQGTPGRIVFRDRGVYLITGGMGGLGMLFAREILGQAATAHIVFTGRSALTDARRDALARLAAELAVAPEQLMYRQLDLAEPAMVACVIAEVLDTCGALHGVIHSAGMHRDSLIVNKTTGDFQQVLAPKVAGTASLDAATRDVELDFLVLFSSLSAVLGNAGQADYAAANGFMDQFAAYRNGLVRAGSRRGHTLALNWPLWQQGGMQLDAQGRALLLRATGMLPLDTATGMRAFHASLAAQAGQVLVMEGQVERLRRLLPLRRAPARAHQLRELLLADMRNFLARDE